MKTSLWPFPLKPLLSAVPVTMFSISASLDQRSETGGGGGASIKLTYFGYRDGNLTHQPLR